MRKALSLMLFTLLSVCPMMQAEAKQPHVLLIMTDDMSWMDLGVQGNPVLRTPNIDTFAAQSMRFTDAYAAAPVCTPTRAALNTGLAPARLHITQHGADTERFWPENRTLQPPQTHRDMSLDYVTLAERLKEAGYATGFFGKWHLGEEEMYWPTAQGFDINIGGCGFGGPPTYWDPYRIPAIENRKEGEYLTNRLADETITWMRKQSKTDNPMFVCLWTYNPHYPFEAPDDLVEHYKGKEGPGLVNPIYGGQIEATDIAVGRVLDQLDKLGMTDDTLVIFTSDNGGWSGATDNRPLREGKGHIYEGGIRVPLIIRWPGVSKAGAVDHTPVITMDLVATILDATGVKLDKSEKLDGESLRPLLIGGELRRDALYWHYPHWAFHKSNRPASAIRMGKFKLIQFYDGDPVELYNLDADIGEMVNLAADRPRVKKNLQHKLQLWLKETGAGIPAGGS